LPDTPLPAGVVYVAMVCDRHSDPEATVFTDQEQAIAWARETARELNRNPGDYKEETIEGWLFCAEYSSEGDSVWVLERGLFGPGGPDA
jgi:hypothetical protein